MIECVIQRHISGFEKNVRLILIAATVFLGVVGVLTVVMLPAFLMALIATVYYSRRLHDEFEYGYNKYTGNLEIARIMNGSRRKTCFESSLDQISGICPYSQCAAIRERGVRIEDYASRRVDAPVYVLTMEQDGAKRRAIIFEPPGEMLREMHQHRPDLVKLD